MRFYLFILILPFLTFSQTKYKKNKHVEIVTNIKNDNYIVEYAFKDHFNQIHNVIFSFDKKQTDQSISKLGIPYTMFDSFVLSEENLQRNKEILKNGLFKNINNKLELDYDAVVSFYKPYCKDIADYLIELLNTKDIDNTLNRIEIAMKFIQDIPYAIPRKNRKIYKNGCLAPVEVLIEGYGDCDSKTLLFASILSHMIPSENILFVKGSNHVLTAVYYDDTILKNTNYFKYIRRKYYICETAGPGRRLFGEKSLKRSSYELLPLVIK